MATKTKPKNGRRKKSPTLSPGEQRKLDMHERRNALRKLQGIKEQ